MMSSLPKRATLNPLLLLFLLLLFWIVEAAQGLLSLDNSAVDNASSRREWLRGLLSQGSAAATVALVMAPPQPSQAFDELPMELRRFTKLVPLGKAEFSPKKSYNSTLEELVDRLSHDLLQGSSGKGSYLLSGDFSEDIFRDDCVFLDPNNRVSSLSQCRNALRVLFDPRRSKLEIIQPLVVVVDKDNSDKESITIKGKIRVRGFLQFPWNPYITAYESNISYKVGATDGLIYQQEQVWSKPASQALQESFTPTIFTPPPKSFLAAQPEEPIDVTTLFGYVNGRRPGEYSAEERIEMDRLVDAIVAASTAATRTGMTRTSQPNQPLLSGKWMLVYLQPGPNGAGIDRRIPFFPEFSFNDNYQIFKDGSVTNVGEVFGPNVVVRVFGDLSPQPLQQQSEDNKSPNVSKEDVPRSLLSPVYKADIRGGKICVGSPDTVTADGAGTGSRCLPLPISGEGLFESVYLGDRIRIGQNLNGGGARVVQVRLS